jgi:hypothetical protein
MLVLILSFLFSITFSILFSSPFSYPPPPNVISRYFRPPGGGGGAYFPIYTPLHKHEHSVRVEFWERGRKLGRRLDSAIPVEGELGMEPQTGTPP